MNEINQSEKPVVTVESRLVQLNQVLAGIRDHLVHSDKEQSGLEGKFEELRLSVFALSSQTKESNKEQVELVESWKERILTLEKLYEDMPRQNSSSMSELEDKLRVLNHTLSGVRENLEELKTEESEPISTESLLENLPFGEINTKIESIQEHYGAIEKHLFESDERQSHHLVRLQQLEISREELLGKTRELWSLNNEFKGFIQDQEGRMDFFEKEKSDLGEKLTALEGQLASKLDEESEVLKASKSDFDSFHAKFEAFQKELTLGVSQALEQCQNIQMEQDRLDREKATIEDVESLRGFNIKQQENIEEMQGNIKDLQAQNSQFEETVQSAQLGHEIMIEGVKVEMSTINEKIDDFKKQFSSEVEQKSQSLNKELVLARDSQYDQHQKVQKELDQVKQQQREIGNLKEALDAKEKETKELKHEIRVLKNEMGGLYRQLREQRTVAFGAIAAAFLLSVGLTYVMIPTSTVSPTNTVAMQETQQFNEAAIEAPDLEIVEVYENEANTASVQNTDFFSDSQAEEPIADIQEPAVTPAFDKEEPVAAEPVVSVNYIDYVVKKGDSVYKIAKNHKGPGALNDRMKRIQQDNNLNGAHIKPGQVLKVLSL